jgi:CubicO group peptidase (beta-lactamase class C family)
MNVVLACVLLAMSGLAAAAPPSGEIIDARVRELMQREEVRGLALAVIDGGKVRHVRAFGFRNVEQKLPLTEDTVMYGASVTKAAFAYFVAMLADEGRPGLDQSLAELLPQPLTAYPEFAGSALDERWRKLTPRLLLNHGAGLANFAFLEPDGKLRFHFDPGSRYAYSGAGINLLQFVLEKGRGMDVGAEMQRRLFGRFGLTRTSMTWRDDFAANMADGYALDGKFEPHDRRDNVRAAGSMDTTIGDQAKLWAALMSGKGLSKNMRAQWARPQLPIRAAHQFPPFTEEVEPRNADIGLAAGLGVVRYDEPDGVVWFKGGHNDVTGNMVICHERHRRCLVMLANDVRAERIYPDIEKLVLGLTRFPWSWEYNYATPTAPAPR